MFTGIVEEIGIVEAVEPSPDGRRLTVRARTVLDGTAPGASIAVNGVCLTVVRCDPSDGRTGGGLFVADLLRQTWEVTNLRALNPGAAVNLERALRAGDRIGGHFVLGHIDGMGIVESACMEGGDRVFGIAVDPALAAGLVPRGSIAVDGVSLTIARAQGSFFNVHCIPHTLRHTTLGSLRAGCAVNIETDILGKYARPKPHAGGITEERLAENGF